MAFASIIDEKTGAGGKCVPECVQRRKGQKAGLRKFQLGTKECKVFKFKP